MHIAILGGVFSPIHKGHLKMAEAVYRHTDADEIWFMPSYNPPHKKNEITDYIHRKNMVEISIKDIPYFSCCDIESRYEGQSYTSLTLARLRDTYREHEFSFIVGEDEFVALESWHEPERIFAMCKIYVHPRNQKMASYGADYNRDELCKYYKDKYSAQIEFVDTPTYDVASSDIRASLATYRDRGDDSAMRKVLPAGVLEYIEENKLYTS